MHTQAQDWAKKMQLGTERPAKLLLLKKQRVTLMLKANNAFQKHDPAYTVPSGRGSRSPHAVGNPGSSLRHR
jgi:hypothetical protein